MDLTLSPEQTEIVSSSAAFLRARLPLTTVRPRLDTDDDKVDLGAWSAAADLGWFALGAAGGRAAASASGWPTRRCCSGRSAGRWRRGRSWPPCWRRGSPPTPAAMRWRRGSWAAPSASAWSSRGALDGTVRLIDADQSLVIAVSPSSAALVAVDALDDVRRVSCVDPAATLRRATATGVLPVAQVTKDVDPIERRGQVLAAAMLTGITEAVRDIAAAHARDRIQFDRPIGVHQAVKHPCAEMAVHAERAYAQTIFAAVAHDEGRRDADFHAVSALLVATAAAESSTAATIQVLGGMGFTYEHDAHLYVKRARLLAQLFGAPSDAPRAPADPRTSGLRRRRRGARTQPARCPDRGPRPGRDLLRRRPPGPHGVGERGHAPSAANPRRR